MVPKLNSSGEMHRGGQRFKFDTGRGSGNYGEENRVVPPGGIEYRNVLWNRPFHVTGIGLPAVSKTSIRPLIVLLPAFTKAVCVIQPPPIAICGKTVARLPPTSPG